MTGRERVLAALDHRTPDRCPLQVSFTPEFADRLRADLRLRGGQPHNPHGGGNTYELERATGQDMLLTSVGWANSYYLQQADTYTDEWGVRWRSIRYSTRFGEGRYTEVIGRPLAEEAAIDHYRAPDPDRPELYEAAVQTIRGFGADYWIVGAVPTTIFETAWALRGLEQLLMDFAVSPELAERVLDIPYHYHLAAATHLADLGVDMIQCGDDVGTQAGMLMSPEMWRRFLKPRLAEFIRALKSRRPGLRIAYHSDGAIQPIIAELIEIGIDLLNPVQPACMDPAALKAKYSESLCFWGTLDEQRTLPFGSPEAVRQEVQSRLETVGRDGGLIIGPTHNVQLDTPLENFWAMIDAVRSGEAEGKTPHRPLQ